MVAFPCVPCIRCARRARRRLGERVSGHGRERCHRRGRVRGGGGVFSGHGGEGKRRGLEHFAGAAPWGSDPRRPNACVFVATCCCTSVIYVGSRVHSTCYTTSSTTSSCCSGASTCAYRDGTASSDFSSSSAISSWCIISSQWLRSPISRSTSGQSLRIK